MNDYEIMSGDCLEILPTLAECSIDSCVTDPPAGISFMGKKWDSDKGGRDHWIAWMQSVMTEVLRVLKPGGHAFVWALPRTSHWTAAAVENAGFEIRDIVMHIFGTGFPKNLDVSKQIDKMHGAEREVVGTYKTPNGRDYTLEQSCQNGYAKTELSMGKDAGVERRIITSATTDEVKQWNGWGTALKPAAEHWILARKPLEKGLTVAQNVLKWGTGAINVDGCRIETTDGYTENTVTQGINTAQTSYEPRRERRTFEPSSNGRWPANVIHDGSDEVLADFPQTTSGNLELHHKRTGGTPPIGTFTIRDRTGEKEFIGDSGSASRFFYCAKSSKTDRSSNGQVNNIHSTVKPVDLMQYLCRLVTPPGGLIIDPFLGSGSTAKAALIERFRIIGIEIDSEYAAIADARCKELQIKLF